MINLNNLKKISDDSFFADRRRDLRQDVEHDHEPEHRRRHRRFRRLPPLHRRRRTLRRHETSPSKKASILAKKFLKCNAYDDVRNK